MYLCPARGHHYDVVARDCYWLDRRRDLHVSRVPMWEIFAANCGPVSVMSPRRFKAFSVADVAYNIITTDNAVMYGTASRSSPADTFYAPLHEGDCASLSDRFSCLSDETDKI